jgi:hypothetical protein
LALLPTCGVFLILSVKYLGISHNPHQRMR